MCLNQCVASTVGIRVRKTMLLFTYLVKKRPFSQKNESFVSNFAWKTPCCHTHIWSKNINSANTTLLYGPKKSIRWSFIRYFTKKSMLACPYFIKNTSILSKTHCSQANKMPKWLPFSEKHCFLISFFFLIFYEKATSL